MDEALIYDWNRVEVTPRPARIQLNDETLRDGLQSPSARTPSPDQKLHILRLLDGLGLDTANIGFPGAGSHGIGDIERLARAIREERLRIGAHCAARTLEADIRPIVEIVQRTGVPIECCCFIGSSPVRRHVERWSAESLQRRTEAAVGFAVRQGLAVMYVAEDATRSDPETLRALFTTAIDAGAARLCVADTVGHATPAGARAVVRFARTIADPTGTGVDWHGHRDRDLGTINSLAALEAGATRVHGTVLGLGERAGNTPIDLLLVNLVLMGWLERDLTRLPELVRVVSAATGEPVPDNYPVFGRNAFRTASGTHAAAVAKALRAGTPALADLVYSGVRAGLVGRRQEIGIGPMSGRANVVFWLDRHGIPADEALVDRIVRRAKASSAALTDDDVRREVAAAAAVGASPVES